MKAIAFNEFGSAEVLQEMDLPEPEPGDNEIKVAVAYSSVNPVDWKIREGWLKDRLPHRFPVIPGWDAAGEVVAVGRSVSNFRAGDSVFAYCRKPEVHDGTYAQFVTVPAPVVAPVPRSPEIGLREAAAVPLVGLTAWQALFEAGGLQRGQSVLVHAGAGGVGSMAIQLARYAGCRVYSTGSAGTHDYLRELGADVAIDYRQDDFVEVLRREAPDGVDLVLDSIGGDNQTRSYGALAEGGTLVSVVGPPDEAEARRHSARAASIFVRPSGEQLRELGALLSAEDIRPPTVEEYALSDAAAAQARSQQGHVHGKLVLSIP